MGITRLSLMIYCVVAACLWGPAIQAVPEVTLVPIDSRPAAAQFPEMVADIGGVAVASPPQEVLGRFTIPGKPDSIAAWLLGHDYTNSIAAVLSADMICYGGLIESRVSTVSTQTARRRLDVLTRLRESHPSLPIYVFSSIMRTAPTATNDARAWRMKLARYVELQDRYAETNDSSLLSSIRSLKREIPALQLTRYLEARKRNLAINEELIRLTKKGVINYLVVGADDAQQYGPHVPELKRMKELTSSLEIAGLVYFCEGVDQDAILLVSRAVLKYRKFVPKVIVRLSEPDAESRRMPFEAKPLAEVVRDQIIASGARPTTEPSEATYTLLVNVPKTSETAFAEFKQSIQDALAQNANIALADINIGAAGGGDLRMLQFLIGLPDLGQLDAFAGWNTASNTIGTAVPHANMILISRQISGLSLHPEVAHREFLLQRLVSDYGYHETIRPKAYALVDALPGASREQLSDEAFRVVQNYVVRTTKSLIEDYFKDSFLGRTIKTADKSYRIAGLANVAVTLPWPRVFETSVRLTFDVQEITAAGPHR